ncbi:Holliday junction branch migration protein RuvA [Jonquetella anthropi]|uniref:Holliday junction branch migration protein RuvA n=1 Tax=Jonquetella anthropi TaxID=428712 RepID=UPI0001B91159|nr:Holliday junction branch migration protein RuvA [Jonquetella anthropi]EEX48470.1 Holliday junction DNA helicase RuvA [Jonquetella anthropi E3_33 E1]
MLASLRGTVILLEGSSAVVECGGLGFQVQLTRKAFGLCRVGESVFLQTYLQVSDAGMSLFGFADAAERQAFELLTTVKGVGGKLAMTVLQSLSAQETIAAVAAGDSKTLTAVPGIGKKTAERICFELSEKITGSSEWSSADLTAKLQHSDEVIEALESLGFDHASSVRAYQQLCQERGEPASTEEAIFNCLRLLKPIETR